MHSYATDVKDRELIPIWLAAFSVALTLLLNSSLEALEWQIPWWVDAPSVMGFYGLLYTFFDKFLWKLNLWGIRFSAIPNIQGTWIGTIKSSYNDGREMNGIALYIHQSWFKMSVQIETETSRSFSTMAVVNTNSSSEPGLKYEYISEPGTFSVQTMQTHRGTANLRLNFDETHLIGEYYTGRGRQNIGDMSFCRVSNEFVPRKKAIQSLNNSG